MKPKAGYNMAALLRSLNVRTHALLVHSIINLGFCHVRTWYGCCMPSQQLNKPLIPHVPDITQNAICHSMNA